MISAEGPSSYVICDSADHPVAIIEVTDDTVVRMGEGFAYRQITYTAHRFKLTFEVRNGYPGCVRLEMSASGSFLHSKALDDQKPATSSESFLRSKDLADIKIDDIRIDCFAVMGVTQTAGGQFVHRLSYRADRKRVERIKTRRKVTPELLQRVAEVHNQATEGQRIEAVKAAFSVAERQALRYIAEARKERLI